MSIYIRKNLLAAGEFDAVTGTPPTYDSQGMICDATGGAAQVYGQLILPGDREFGSRFLFAPLTAGAAAANIFVAITDPAAGSADMRLQITTGRVLRIQCRGATAVTGPTLALNELVEIEVSMNTSGASSVFNWSVNGAAQTGSTIAATPADITFLRVGQSTSTTWKLRYGRLLGADTVAEYPLPSVRRAWAA